MVAFSGTVSFQRVSARDFGDAIRQTVICSHQIARNGSLTATSTVDVDLFTHALPERGHATSVVKKAFTTATEAPVFVSRITLTVAVWDYLGVDTLGHTRADLVTGQGQGLWWPAPMQ